MTHDYKRNGVTTLFAALNVRDGTVLGRCMAQHRHQEFIRFLNAIERAVPPGKLITPSPTTTRPTNIPRCAPGWSAIPRWVFHFTPTSASWINAVEGFFSTLTRQGLKRGVFCSVDDLEQAIADYIRQRNGDPKPFVWTKPAKAILDKLSRLPEPPV